MPHGRAARVSLVGRIHWATWNLVCSMTDNMPSELGEQRRRPRSGAEIGGHGVDKRIGGGTSAMKARLCRSSITPSAARCPSIVLCAVPILSTVIITVRTYATTACSC
jgi:hypothetical protein